ncbi:MAG: NAD(P)H-hydrate dehydratase, partial [Gemmatimonadaceae bacterium]|nr:NAD(P)H-hydrate dehydratase [Gemmatimonadaceae bacterium]
MPARVASASQSVACESATMAAGVTAGELMRRAGRAVAEVIIERFPRDGWPEVVIAAGPGNNGGDGRIIGEVLSSAGYRVQLVETATGSAGDIGETPLIVDALLGTGSTGAPRGNIAPMIAAIEAGRAAGAKVVSVDLPSGLDASSGEFEGAITADLTLALGTMKRGMLLSREVCGEILVLDIGLTEGSELTSLPLLVDREWVRRRVPIIPRTAHKGTRKRLAVVGGGRGMAGAAILTGRGALRSGIGLLHVLVDSENVGAIHAGIPEALAGSWPETPEALASLGQLSDVIAIGPGLGRSNRTRELVETVLLAYSGRVVLDADALNDFENDVKSLAVLLDGRPAIITPHPAELGRLLGISTRQVLNRRFDIGAELSRQLGAAVLLKGTPTVVFAPGGERYATASGTAALATGGSGDILTGICATLLSQMDNAGEAAACAAFTHGRAAELCNGVRGVTLDDVLRAMPAAWNERGTPPR